MIKKISLNENLFHFLNIIMHTLNILSFFRIYFLNFIRSNFYINA